MNIIMFTNIYKPRVGGVTLSVIQFTEEFRRRGHRVLIVAPTYEGMDPDEEDVVRVPAIQNFNGSDYSVALPIPGVLKPHLDEFKPDIVHAHHPFLLGGSALRTARHLGLPLVYTHHTMFEYYTYIVPGDSRTLRDFVVQINVGFSNLCDLVVAPSQSLARVLKDRRVHAPVAVIPTGVDVERFSRGDGAKARRALEIPDEAFVVGHVGRLKKEKNLGCLAEGVASFLDNRPEARFLVVGHGEAKAEIERAFERHDSRERVHFAGTLEGQDLIDAYHAMDVFAFTSLSETQGMVLVEAMAAGTPVVALEASGVRDVVDNGINGWLLPAMQGASAIREGLEWFFALEREGRERIRAAARETAGRFSMKRCADRMLGEYERLARQSSFRHEAHEGLWAQAMENLKAEWELFENTAGAAVHAIREAVR